MVRLPGQVEHRGILHLWEWLEKDVGKEHIAVVQCDWRPADETGVWKQRDCQERVDISSSLPSSLLFLSQVFVVVVVVLHSVCGQDFCSSSPIPALGSLGEQPCNTTRQPG